MRVPTTIYPDPVAFLQSKGDRLTLVELHQFSIDCCLRVRGLLPAGLVRWLRHPEVRSGRRLKPTSLIQSRTLHQIRSGLAQCQSSSARHAIVCALYDPSLFEESGKSLISKLDPTFRAAPEAFTQKWSFAQLSCIYVAYSRLDLLRIEGAQAREDYLTHEYSAQLGLLFDILRTRSAKRASYRGNADRRKNPRAELLGRSRRGIQ
jgi:hypothetical protein